ncbi:MAG: PAS domain S-box protein [Nitriliruptorales bacterium]|nr:PAS domain S-box protein [Nitriliruptorales bacterium]
MLRGTSTFEHSDARTNRRDDRYQEVQRRAGHDHSTDRDLRVLLVEDDAEDALLIRSGLEGSRWAFDLAHATRLSEAMRQIDSGLAPDVVLLDLELPDSSGLQTFTALRAALPGVPVVVLTGFDDDDTAGAALQAGAQDYLIKGGSNEDATARAIRHAVERERLSNEIARHLQQRGALVELGRVALTGISEDELARRACAVVADALQVREAVIAVRDRKRGTLVLMAHCGFELPHDPLALPEDDSTVAGRVALANAPILIQDLDAEGGQQDPVLRELGVRSVACVPVPDSDGPQGVLAAVSDEAGHFGPGDVEFLTAVASLLSEAFHRRASEEALVERVKERAALYRISRALAEERSRPITVGQVADALANGLRFPDLAIATVVIDGAEVRTRNDPPAVNLRADILVGGEKRGELWVGYTEPRSFLPEEEQLLDEAASTISVWLAREDAVRDARGREAFLDNLLAQVPGTVWTTDADLRLVSSRGTGMARLGITEQDVKGRHIDEIIRGASDDTPGIAAHRQALCGVPTSYRYTAGGRVRQAYVEPVRGAEGAIQGVIGSSVDITDAERTQEELRTSQLRLQAVLDRLPVCIWTVDGSLTFTSVRGSGLAAIGQTESDIVGRTLEDYFQTDDPEFPPIAAHRAALEGESSTFQIEWLGVCFHVRVEPLRDEHGVVAGVAGVALDVTDLHHTRQELEESQRVLRGLFEHSLDGFLLWDDDGNYLDANPAMEALTGYSRDEIRQMSIGDLSPQDFKADARALANEVRQGERWTREHSLRRKDGSLVDVFGSAVPDIAPGIHLATAQDITERKEAEQALTASEERFRALVKFAPDVIAVLDEDAQVTYLSPAIHRVSGWTVEELADKDAWELLHPDDRDEARAFWDALLYQTDPVGPVQYRLRDRNGSYRHVEALYTNRLEDPAVNGVIANLRDVTAQHIAERALRESEERFRRLADNAPDIIFRMSVNPDPAFEYISPAVEAITGYTVGQCYDDPDLALQILDPSDHDIVRQAREGRPPRTPRQVTVRRPDGTTVWLDVRFVPVTDRGDRVVGVEGVARDITSIKQAEDTLREALRREQAATEHLRELDRMKNGFLQAVSHELRTPLTSLIGFSSILQRRDELSVEKQELIVARLIANATRLESLLTDLLDVDRMTRGALEPTRSPHDVVELGTRVAAEFLADGTTVRVDGDPIMAEIDGPKTERIIENLIRNAAKHAPDEAPILLRIEADGEGVLVSVCDRGPGVPDGLKTSIFEPFRQGETAAAKVGGLGIGLAVVSTFARLHGGRAWVEDREGRGSCFKVLLPARILQPASHADPSAAEADGALENGGE